MSQLDMKRDLARLQVVLDVHGANPARWPRADAERLAALTQSDPQAGKLLAEAQAFDRILAAAPSGPPGGLDALTDRILSRTAATKPAIPGSAEIVPLPVRPRNLAMQAGSSPLRLWPALAALAAALIIGIYIGNADLLTPALQQVAGLTADEAEPGAQSLDEAQEGELM